MAKIFEQLGEAVGKGVAAFFKNLAVFIIKNWPFVGKYIDETVLEEMITPLGDKPIPKREMLPKLAFEIATKYVKDLTMFNITDPPDTITIGADTERLSKLKGPFPAIAGIMFGASFAMSLTSSIFEGLISEPLRQYGYSVGRSKLYDPQLLRAGSLRKEINDDTVTDQLQRMGFTDEKIEAIKKLFWEVPPVQDVIRFALREVFDPQRFQELISEPIPDAAYEWGAKVGLDKDTLDKYWAAHWVLPPIEQLNTMLYRGEIDQATWDRFVRYNDYDPSMRDKLQKIIYNPYTRVDARRMHDLRVLDDKALTKAYGDIGYDKEHADNLTVWTKLFNAIPSIRERYAKGHINADDVEQELTDTGLAKPKVAELKQRIVREEKPTRTEKERELTKAEIIKGIKLEKLDIGEGKTLLEGLGYDGDEADFLIETGIATLEKTPVERDITRADVIRALNRALISKEEAIKMLEDMYFEAWEARFIVDAYYDPVSTEEEAARTRKNLTKAEIIKGLKQGVINDAQAIAALVELGYEGWEAQYIVVINVKPPESSPLSYGDFDVMVQKWRKSQGLKATVLGPEALALEKTYIKARQEVENAKQRKASEAEIATLTLKLQDAEKAYRDAIRLAKELEKK